MKLVIAEGTELDAVMLKVDNCAADAVWKNVVMPIVIVATDTATTMLNLRARGEREKELRSFIEKTHFPYCFVRDILFFAGQLHKISQTPTGRRMDMNK
jgi:hypothetical protein